MCLKNFVCAFQFMVFGKWQAWLDPVDHLPTGRLCRCDICDTPLQFLLQVRRSGHTFCLCEIVVIM